MTLFVIYGPGGTGKTTNVKDFIAKHHRDRVALYSRNTDNQWTSELVNYQELSPSEIEAHHRADPDHKRVVVWDTIQDVPDYFAQSDVRNFYTLVKTDPLFANVVLCIVGPASFWENHGSFYTEAVASW